MREVTFKELTYEVGPDDVVTLTVVDDMGGHEGTSIASLVGAGRWWRSFEPGAPLRADLGPGRDIYDRRLRINTTVSRGQATPNARFDVQYGLSGGPKDVAQLRTDAFRDDEQYVYVVQRIRFVEPEVD